MSSSLYNPDDDAGLTDFESIKLLSQRDLSSTIPINFVTVPGVSLKAACFPVRRYDSASATKCVSNLLAAGFRRLELDLYWDVSRASWSFCPVELGDVEPGLSRTQDSTVSQTPSSSATLTAGGLGEPTATSSEPESTSSDAARVRPRQTGGSSVLSQSSRSTMSASSLPSATSTQTAVIHGGDSTATVEGSDPDSTGVPNDETMLNVGNFTCSTQLDFHLFLQVLYGHFANTESDLEATTKYLVLNLHAAASASDPESPGEQPSEDNLPRNNNLLSSLISANNSQYLYTPSHLSDQRANLNSPGSWFTVSRSNSPDTTYYEVNSSNSNNIATTSDGWPSESVVELARARRMLAGFGRIDPEMEGYDFSSDASTIFQPGVLQDSRDVSFASNGSIAGGCIFDASNPSPSVENSNSSWATTDTFAEDSSSSISLEIRNSQASNLTDCGISPILNTTLLSSPANDNPVPYKDYALSTIWSWAENEPRIPDTSDQDAADNLANRCAVLNATSSRWQSHECGNSHHAACRVNDEPYSFRVSDASAAYEKAENACRGEVAFTAARTALENSYLTAAWRAYRSDNDVEDELLWVDFNDLDVARCWVIGQNSTCPYQEQQLNEGRQVVVPVVAAVIVFVLALLTIFIKCAANRRNTRRRRKRVDDGWDYEGVPS